MKNNFTHFSFFDAKKKKKKKNDYRLKSITVTLYGSFLSNNISKSNGYIII